MMPQLFRVHEDRVTSLTGGMDDADLVNMELPPKELSDVPDVVVSWVRGEGVDLSWCSWYEALPVATPNKKVIVGFYNGQSEAQKSGELQLAASRRAESGALYIMGRFGGDEEILSAAIVFCRADA